MNPETWQRVNDLLLEALDLPEDLRTKFLATVDSQEPLVGQELRSLLAADTGAVASLDHPAVDLRTASSELQPGAQVGPHQIIREIGRGGTGIVYLARRVDGELERQVAVKILKRGMDTDDLVHRFRTERQILANLEHPHIAKLFESGSTDDHRPFFVMEYVDGVPIDAYCDRHRLTVSQRLKLFVKVCSAVEKAHRSLVVHRDLKPSNILVTHDAEPKLLDFGIAKLLDPETFEPLTRTATGRTMMTPEYASPEQVRGDVLTTSTDIYSLGVLLFELLTGHRPYQLKNRRLDEALDVVCREEPERPSSMISRIQEIRARNGTRTTITPETVSWARGDAPRRLRRRLVGDLDNIVLMALRKEPSRRYPSVSDLAEDLERHLQGLTVRARPDTLAYRAGKLLRRRKKETAAAALILGLATFWGFERLDQQRRLQQERDRAQHVSEFLVDIFQVSDPSEARGNQVTAREILDRGVERIHERLAENPSLRAALTLTTARVYRNLGLYTEAETLAETAVELNGEVYGPNSGEFAGALAARATLHYDQGQLKEAESLFRRTYNIRRAVLGESHSLTVTSLNDVAVMLERQSKYEQAEPLFRQVLKQQRARRDADVEVAQTLSNLGVLLQNRLDFDGAEAAFRESLDLKRRRLGESHPGVALGLNNLALLMKEKGDFEAAQQLFIEALGLARKVYGHEHPNVAKSLSNLAGVYEKTGKLELAEETFLESLAMRRKLLGPDHPGVARDLILLARLAANQDNPAEAAERARGAVDILPDDERNLRPVAESLLGECLLKLGQAEQARPFLENSYQTLLESRGAHSGATQRAVRRLIELHRTLGEFERADELSRLLTDSEASAG